MELVILGVANAVLLILLFAALKLIRGDAEVRAEPVEDGAIDLRDSVVEPVSGEARTADPERGGSSTEEDLDPAVHRPPSVGVPATTEEVGAGSINLPRSLRTFERSAIVVDSTLNGSGPTPNELLFSVIEVLREIGLRITNDSPTSGTLRDEHGYTATVELTRSQQGNDRIAIAVDSERAVEALAMLEVWHRSQLGSTDRVRLSARIR